MCVVDRDAFGPNILNTAKRSHFTSQCRQTRLITIDGGVGKVQIAYHAVTVKLTEQAGIKVADGVAAAVIVAAKRHNRFTAVMAEAAGLLVAGIRRVIILADLTQCFAVGNVYRLLR